MLALQRHPGESVIIELPSGELIEIQVVRFVGVKDRVRLGIEAPPHIKVDRAEVFLHKQNGRPVDAQRRGDVIKAYGPTMARRAELDVTV